MQRPLAPGELTKPVRVWCTSSSIRIAWYQAEPISETVTVFYKKPGSLFGTEIALPTSSLLGPELSMRPPPVQFDGRAQYFELDIRKLKPNTQYVVKVRASGSQSILGDNLRGSNQQIDLQGQGVLPGLQASPVFPISEITPAATMNGAVIPDGLDFYAQQQLGGQPIQGMPSGIDIMSPPGMNQRLFQNNPNRAIAEATMPPSGFADMQLQQQQFLQQQQQRGVSNSGAATAGMTSGGGGGGGLTGYVSGAFAGVSAAAAAAAGTAQYPSFTTRSDRLSTLGVQEEQKRNTDMGNFVGSLVRLGDYDGTVTSFEAATGLYEVRILQDEASSALQLVRLASEYSDLGLTAKTYTLSTIRFGRWGGEISGSQLVGEGELKWVVGRSVQLAERGEAASTFAMREESLQARNRELQAQLDAQREVAVASLALTRRTYQALFITCLLFSLVIAGWSWSHSWKAGLAARNNGDAARAETEELRAQLRRLELYRASLELGAGNWIQAQGAMQQQQPRQQSGMPFGAYCAENGTSPNNATNGFGAAWQSMCSSSGAGGNQTSNMSNTGATCEGQYCTSTDPSQYQSTAYTVNQGSQGEDPAHVRDLHPLLDPNGPLIGALHGSHANSKSGDDSAHLEGSSGSHAGDQHGSSRSKPRQRFDLDLDVSADTDPPLPQEFVAHASTMYALYVNEWVKLHMAARIRRDIQQLLHQQKQGNGAADASRSHDDLKAAGSEQGHVSSTKSGKLRQQDGQRGDDEDWEGYEYEQSAWDWLSWDRFQQVFKSLRMPGTRPQRKQRRRVQARTQYYDEEYDDATYDEDEGAEYEVNVVRGAPATPHAKGSRRPNAQSASGERKRRQAAESAKTSTGNTQKHTNARTQGQQQRQGKTRAKVIQSSGVRHEPDRSRDAEDVYETA